MSVKWLYADKELVARMLVPPLLEGIREEFRPF